MQKISHLGIKMDPELHDKFMVVSDYEGRSMSRQILYLMTAYVREFETAHGKITAEDIETVKRKQQKAKKE